jgi:hypothetical protein
MFGREFNKGPSACNAGLEVDAALTWVALTLHEVCRLIIL